MLAATHDPFPYPSFLGKSRSDVSMYHASVARRRSILSTKRTPRSKWNSGRAREADQELRLDVGPDFYACS